MGIITYLLKPATSQTDTVWMSNRHFHTQAVARLKDIQPYKTQGAPGPFTIHITPYSIPHPHCDHYNPSCSTLCS